jgi:hypothetical protein
MGDRKYLVRRSYLWIKKQGTQMEIDENAHTLCHFLNAENKSK